MSKSYREMNLQELREEIRRVNALLRNKPSPNAYHQNRKYLDNLERQYRIKMKGGK